jgi:hypothetical protein
LELRDLIITPIVIILVFAGAYLIRPRMTDPITRRYFLPALAVKVLGAIALGFIYQFYYNGGDTFNFHTHGSRHIWEAFMDSPSKAFTLIFTDNLDVNDVYKYSSRIFFLKDTSSYFVIRVAGFFDLITFSSYSATAISFAVFGFIGMWLFFLTFYKLYPNSHVGLAIASFFIPSVFFWGSGLLKDTIVTGCLGIATYYFHTLLFEKKISAKVIIILFLALYTIFRVKIFVLQAYLPSIIIWLIAYHFNSIRSRILRMMLVPLAIVIVLISSYYSVVAIGENDTKYAISNIARTAQITAYDIRYWTGRDAGSGYSLGELNGTWQNMVALAPQAINVSLFRPYLWEVTNPFMFLSALESLTLLLITLYLFFRRPLSFVKALGNPDIIFCLVFSLTFAFAVGIATFNFGTLVRYKIPLLPFFSIALVLIAHQAKRPKNV